MKLKLFVERGQALVLIALAAIGLFGVTGLVIDGGAKFSDRRHAQNAADTAAMSAALSLASNKTSACGGGSSQQWQCDALNIANTNGYDRNLVTNLVWVGKCSDPRNDLAHYPLRYNSPVDCGSAYEGNPGYVQVVIRSYVNTTFARVIGINRMENTVSAVVLTKEGGPLVNGASIVSLNPNPSCAGGVGGGGGSVDVGGNGTINLTGGGIFVNAGDPPGCGYSQTSCSVTLNVAGGANISSAGSTINMGGCSASIPTDETGQSVLIPDEVYMPDEPIECSQTHAIPTNPSGNDWTIYPGYYTDFPQGGLIANNKDITLAPGVYCVDSDIHWSGSTFTSLDGTSGVTIYIKSGHNFSMSINSPIWLNPSTSGEYKGYLIILDGNMNNIQNCTINGGSYLDINGTIFAPYCNLTVNGDNSSNSEFNAQLIGWDVKLNGNNTITFNYDPSKIAENKRRVGLMR
jgi:hypothetical protein